MNTIWKEAATATSFLERRGGIPFAQAQLEVLVHLAGQTGRPPRRLLDLGCGEGLVGEVLLTAFPEAGCDFGDFNKTMLERAAERLGGRGGVRLIEADLQTQPLPSVLGESLGEARYDAVASGLALHHLTDERKQAIYAEIFGLLEPGGCFVNLEHVAAASPRIGDMWQDIMCRSLYDYEQRRGGHDTLEQVRAAWLKRAEANRLVRVEEQCEWLRRIGFEDVDVFFKYFELAVFGGYRPRGSGR